MPVGVVGVLKEESFLDLAPPNCNNCGAGEAVLLYQAQDIYYNVDPRTYLIVQCNNCGLVYLTPRPTPAAIEKAYPPDYLWNQAIDEAPATAPLEDRLRAWYFRRLSGARARWVNRLLNADRRAAILDIGCGRGGFLKAMHRLGYRRLRGIELAADNVSHLRAECPDLRITQGDFMEANTGWEKTFDLVALWHVLEHLHDPKAALAKVREVVKPGGLLVLGTQNFDSFSQRVMGPAWPLNDVPRHLYHFTRKTLRPYLERAGFHWKGEWHLTEFFPAMGGHLFAYYLMRPDHSIRVIPGLLATLLFSPLELPLVFAGKGCILTVAALAG